MDQLDLSDFFKTKIQALDFSIRLSLISQKIYETEFNLEKELMKHFGLQKRDKFITLLTDSKIDITSQQALKEFFSIVQLKVSSLPIITLKLALEPSEQMLQTLSQWFMTNVNKQVLFDISVDSSLIGGAGIFFNSKYLDFSVKTRFDLILKDVLTPQKEPAVPEKNNVQDERVHKDELVPVNKEESKDQTVQAKPIVVETEPINLPNGHVNVENISFGR